MLFLLYIAFVLLHMDPRYAAHPKYYHDDITTSWGRFKKVYELFNLRALEVSSADKIYTFHCTGRCFVCNIKGTH